MGGGGRLNMALLVQQFLAFFGQNPFSAILRLILIRFRDPAEDIRQV